MLPVPSSRERAVTAGGVRTGTLNQPRTNQLSELLQQLVAPGCSGERRTMAARAENSGRGVTEPRRGSPSRVFTSTRTRALLGAVPRLILLFVIIWAFTEPVVRVPLIAGAAGLAPVAPADLSLRASPAFQETGFAVADGPIGAYFVA